MVSVNICDGSCKNINDQYARVCILNKIKYINVKRFTLMPGVNETRFLVQRKSCKCKSKCNCKLLQFKAKWNHNECWRECKESDDWSYLEKGYVRNLNKCDCECNKAC